MSKNAFTNETAEYMIKKGVTNHLQARYQEEISKVISSSDSFSFSQMKSKCKLRNKKSWDAAYRLVASFLKDYQMSSTTSTIQLELGDQLDFLNLEMQNSEPQFDFFSEITQNIPLSATFQERVQEFSKVLSTQVENDEPKEITIHKKTVKDIFPDIESSDDQFLFSSDNSF